jgi:pimeloyl-ACP methyl ester carboxylesterase
MAQDRNPGSGNPGDVAIGIHRVDSWTPPEDQTGDGIVFRTTRGDLHAIRHGAPDSDLAVVFVCGARGGFGGPGPGTYVRLAESFKEQGITSLRLDYRYPNDLYECFLDLLAAVEFLKDTGFGPVVVVGHSFGGAVVIAAGAASPHVKGVVALSSQTFGADRAWQISPRPLLLIHGKADTRLPFYCSQQIYDRALEPKQIVFYDGAEHRLEECRDEMDLLLSEWIPDTLRAPVPETSG